MNWKHLKWKKNTFHTQHERISVHSHTYTFRPTNTCVHRDVSVWPQRCECVGAARAHQHTQTEHLRTPTRQNPHTRTGSYVHAWRRRRRKCRWIKNDLAANFDVLSRFIHSESYRGRNGRIGGFFLSPNRRDSNLGRRVRSKQQFFRSCRKSIRERVLA